ncbi:dopa decarboxylase, putative, partial [Bodo saltans]
APWSASTLHCPG